MSRTKKQSEDTEVTSVDSAENVTEEAAVEAPQFPYIYEHKDYGMKLTVVSESTDEGGRTVLHTADGCSYHK